MTSKMTGRDLFQRVGKTRRWVALSSLLGVITVGSGIGLLAMAIYLLTRSAVLGAAASLSLTILGVRFFALTRVVGRYCERYLGHLGTFRVLTRLRVWLFEQLIETDAIVLANRRRGDVVTGIIDDVDTMQDRLLRVSSPPFVAAGTLLIAVAALLVINARSAVILTGFFLVGALTLPPLLWSRTRLLSAQVVRLRAKRLTEATELIDGRETLVLWGRTDLLANSLAHFDAQEAVLTHKLTRTRALLDAAVISLTGLCVLAIVIALRATSLSVSTIWWITAVPLIALASFEALGPLLAAPDYRAQTDAAAKRILTIADSSVATSKRMTSELAPAQPTSTPAIEISGLFFSYNESAKIFSGLSLTIPFGSTVSISAPSGTGKSTLLELLVGLLPFSEGSIAIGGCPPADLSKLRRPLIAAVMQHDHVFDTTVRDNLLVGDGDATDQQLLAACATAGLLPFLETRPGGLDAPIGPNGDLLSGGERQRLMIARALLADAPILILDEATEHLEPELRGAVIDAVLRSRQGRTTLILAHDVDAISRADVAYDLVDGVVARRES